MVEKIVEDAIKEYGKVSRNRKAKEWSCNECQISRISSQPIKVYFKIEEGKGQVTSYTFFDDGEKFISSANDEAGAEVIKRMNIDIYNDVKRAVFAKELEQKEKELKDFEKDLSKLEKKNENLHEDIANYKEKILNAEKEIEQNLQHQVDKKIEIEQQKKVVKAVTDKLNNVGRN
jgi:hypothetical protein